MSEPYDVLATNPVATPQTEPIPGREADMVKNAAGGYGFVVDKWARLGRFLLIGTTGGTYYQSARDLTKENLTDVLACLKEDGPRVVSAASAVNVAGRAPKVDQQLFVMALAMTPGYADEDTRRIAADALPDMLRTFTHVAVFCKYLESQRGWGEVPRRAVRAFFERKSAVALAYQGAKYPQREGWTPRDVMRLVHPKPPTEDHSQVYDWLTHGLKAPALMMSHVVSIDGMDERLAPAEDPTWPEHIKVIWRYETAQAAAKDGKRVEGAKAGLVALIRSAGLPWEAVPMAWRADPDVWDAALPTMPQTATLRNLGQLTSKGVLKNEMDKNTGMVVARIRDKAGMNAARVHPLSVYQTMMVYKSGHGEKGSNSWSPLRSVVDSLDTAFYDAFGNVEPTGKPILIAIDSSGSMGASAGLGNFPGATVREVAAALAMVYARTEPMYQVVGFDQRLHELSISPRQRLDDVVNSIPKNPTSTDASLPFGWALDKNLGVEAFVVITDNETWYGPTHPVQAFNRYRKQTGIKAKLVVVAMTASRSTIGDTHDPDVLEVVGFDSAAPAVVSEFIRGVG